MADETIRTDKDWNEKPVDRTYDRAVNADTEDCSSSDAGPAAAMGGVGGAITGAVAGSATGPAGAVLGAVIGGVAGAVASGAAVGAIDRIDNDDAIKGEACNKVDTYGTRTFEPAEPALRKSWGLDASDLSPGATYTTPDYPAGTVIGSRFENWDQDFRTNWMTNYYGTGSTYDDYEPAYRFGYVLYSQTQYVDRDWSEFEDEARKDWEERHTGTWDRYMNSIRYGWERAKEALTGDIHDDAGRRVA